MDVGCGMGETAQLSCLVGAAASAPCGCEEPMGDARVQEFCIELLKYETEGWKDLKLAWEIQEGFYS